MKLLLIVCFLTTILISCRTLNSVTTIKSNDSFILGNNEHGPFTVKMNNISAAPVTVYQLLPGGEKVKTKIVEANEKALVKVPDNTALVIDNRGYTSVSIKLKVYGDTGLSMKYKQ